MNKAQGTIEYLVIVGVVIVIGLTVVATLTGFFETTPQITTTTARIQTQTQTLTLNDAIITPQGELTLEIQSNQTANNTITKITIDNTNEEFATNNTFTLGEKKYSKYQPQKTAKKEPTPQQT